MKGFCVVCGDQTNRDSRAKYCWGCIRNGSSARYTVSVAVKKGVLPKVTSMLCVDCGVQAEHYDHRDYNQPLVVHPVCRSCNAKRGIAIPDVRLKTNAANRKMLKPITHRAIDAAIKPKGDEKVKYTEQDLADARRQGEIVLHASGLLPCALMIEHSYMYGYLSATAKRDPLVAEFMAEFEKRKEMKK